MRGRVRGRGRGRVRVGVRVRVRDRDRVRVRVRVGHLLRRLTQHVLQRARVRLVLYREQRVS